MDYGDVLQHYLDLKGITPAELARRIGRPKTTVYALLHGRAKDPTPMTAMLIADALGVSVDEMAEMAYGKESE